MRYGDEMNQLSTHKPIVIDLFAGAGGLSLGAFRAGFNVACAAELDKHAIETHSYNFPSVKHLQIDLSTTSSNDLLSLAVLQNKDIAGIIGGPPCQGFSSMGHGQVDDIRNSLFIRFFQFVSEIQPIFFIAENVLGIMNAKYSFIRQKAFEQVTNYTILPPLMINASEYGAPTTRTRVFFIGYDAKRISAMSEQDFDKAKCSQEYAVRVKDALEGLPLDISTIIDGNGIIEPMYKKVEIKKSPFHLRILECIPDGIGNKQAIRNYLHNNIVTGCMPTKHSDKVRERYEKLGYGKQDKVSKSIKLDPNGFCPTLRAGTGPERGSYQAVRPIHYAVPRVITPREAARLQGFPDWFVFDRTIWHSFRQIGNSVSPIVAEAILSVVHHKLT